MSEEVSCSRAGGPLIVAVEGNIGSGKSTFLSYCETDDCFELIYEPVNKWSDIDGVNLLEKFYSDPVKWGFTFQMEVNVSMLELYLQRSSRPIKLVERSLLSASIAWLQNGWLEPVMISVLDHWHDVASNHLSARPHAIVYLETAPTVAHHRLRTRGRVEESSVSLQYLSELDAAHSAWLGNLQHSNMAGDEDIPIFVIDANRPFHDLVHDYDECVKSLKLLLL